MTAKRSTLAIVVMLGGGLMAARAPAQDSDTARVNAMLACATIGKSSARLACYDAQAQGVAVRPRSGPPRGFEPAPTPTPTAMPTVTTSAPTPPPAPAFGDVKPRKTKAERSREVTEMIAHATAATDNGIGHWAITLDNGQVWRMSESVPNFAPPRAGDEVRIRKGSLGGYLMDVNHQGGVRVDRIE
jgi:hypothetical protein